MFCFESASIVASSLGLLGSLILIYPAWNASRILRFASNYEHQDNEADDQLDKAIIDTVNAIKKETGRWTVKNHHMLIAGICIMASGGLVSLTDAFCKY